MKSMTGYGRGSGQRETLSVVVEARSVNHRYLDVKIRGGVGGALEEKLTRLVKNNLHRGSVVLQCTFKNSGGTATLDLEALRGALGQIREFARNESLEEPRSAAELLSVPGIWTGSTELTESEQELIAKAAEEALVMLVAMRETEGESLKKDIVSRIKMIASLRERVASQVAMLPEHQKQVVKERVETLLEASGGKLDADRLAQEVAHLVDRADVTEELVRLESHLAQALELCESNGPIGKKMGFLLQEMGREVNTTGSKNQLAAVSELVIEMKTELERIREQVLNVE